MEGRETPSDETWGGEEGAARRLQHFFFLKETKAREKAKWNSIELEGGYIVIVHLLVYLTVHDKNKVISTLFRLMEVITRTTNKHNRFQ